MIFKRFKVLTVLLGLVAAFSFIAAPLMAETVEKRPIRGLHEWLQTLPELQQEKVLSILDTAMELNANGFVQQKNGKAPVFSMEVELESVLSSKQMEEFKSIFTRKPVSSTLSTCGDCYWPNYFIYKALSAIEQAIASYYSSNHYCEDPDFPWGMPPYDYAITAMEAARSHLINAESKSWDAYQTCDCSKATSAQYNLGRALVFIGYAIQESNDYCDPNPPWMSDLTSAQTWANGAVSSMQDCVDQACN